MKTARAKVKPIRQENQYACMASSLAAAMFAHKKNVTEEEVNRVMGASPFRGASWEELLATAQYFGMRGTLVVPATLSMLKAWTDRGIPVIIAWNPEDRPWSHASVVVDVKEDNTVHVMDPNIPDPNEHFRVVSGQEFYKIWGEPLGDKMIVRRPACAIEREVSPEGRQMVASKQSAVDEQMMNRASNLLNYMDERDALKHLIKEGVSRQDAFLAVKAGKRLMKDRTRVFEQGRQKRREAGYRGNPGGKDIYENDVEHGYGEPLAGGTDVMRKLQNRLLHEQGRPQRPESPRLARTKVTDEEALEYLNSNMVRFHKGTGWWLPAHNLGVNRSLVGGFNLWVYTILPAFPKRSAYFPAGDDPITAPEGIIIRPLWVPHPKYADKGFPVSIQTSEAMVKQAKIAASVGETTQREMAWIEKEFGISIPSSIKAKYTQQASKLAARRWGVNRLRTQGTFVPLDGRKPVPMPSMGRPRIKAAVRVADRYMDRLGGN
jgi:hypothetical protein